VPTVPWPSPSLLRDYFERNPQAFIVGNQRAANDLRELQSFRDIVEMVNAGYFMGSFNFGKLNVLIGARIEITDFESTNYADLGNNFTNPGDRYQRRTVAVSETPDPFKNLQLKYVIKPDLIARAAYTDGQGRQNFGDLIPNIVFDDDNLRISANESGLKPRRSKNYDVSLEYYIKPAGNVSLGWFRKEVKDYITSTALILGPGNQFGPEYDGWELRSFKNAGQADYEGLEFDYRQKFMFLPGWFKGFEIFGNYTNIYFSEGDFGQTLGGRPFIRTELEDLITEFANGGVSFITPDRRLFIQAKCNYRGQYLATTNNVTATLPGGVNNNYNDTRRSWDFNVRYTISRRYDVEFVVRDAFIDPRKISRYLDSIYTNWNEYGAQYSLIFRLRL
jgi:TonB-dependent receptor